MIPLNNSYMGLGRLSRPGSPLPIRDRLRSREGAVWRWVVVTILILRVKSSCLDRDERIWLGARLP